MNRKVLIAVFLCKLLPLLAISQGGSDTIPKKPNAELYFSFSRGTATVRTDDFIRIFNSSSVDVGINWMLGKNVSIQPYLGYYIDRGNHVNQLSQTFLYKYTNYKVGVNFKTIQSYGKYTNFSVFFGPEIVYRAKLNTERKEAGNTFQTKISDIGVFLSFRAAVGYVVFINQRSSIELCLLGTQDLFPIGKETTKLKSKRSFLNLGWHYELFN